MIFFTNVRNKKHAILAFQLRNHLSFSIADCVPGKQHEPKQKALRWTSQSCRIVGSAVIESEVTPKFSQINRFPMLSTHKMLADGERRLKIAYFEFDNIGQTNVKAIPFLSSKFTHSSALYCKVYLADARSRAGIVQQESMIFTGNSGLPQESSVFAS